jgi:hypothetical protein
VLQAAASLSEQAQEDIFLKGQEAPHPPVFLDDFRQITGRALAIPLSSVAGGNQVVLAAIDDELLDIQIAGNNRRIDERVKIRRPVVVRLAVPTGVESRHRLGPFGRQLQVDVVRTPSRFDE